VHLQAVNPFDYADWNKRIESLGSSSFFNSIEWARVLSESYGYEPCYVVGIEGERFVSLLPLMHISSWLTGKRGVALPFSDNCEIIGLNQTVEENVLKFLKALGQQKKWRSFEVRNGKCFDPSVPSASTYYYHALDLTLGVEALFGQIEGTVRTAIRKAVKNGVEVAISATLESVRLFYHMHCETRRRHGLPPQPFAFFKNLYQHVLSNGMGFVGIARHQGVAIAASIFCHFEGHAVFKYGASDLRLQEYRGSTMVMWEAIQWYVQQGYKHLSLGRTLETNSGLRRFKLGWGACETRIHYVKYDLRHQQFISCAKDSVESGFGVVKIMPLFLNRLAGNILYRHMG